MRNGGTQKIKSHIAGSSLTSKASLEDAIKHGEMQELFALYRICIAIAANEAFGFGNGRLKKLFDTTDEAMQVFDDYAGCIGVSKARGYLDMDTGIAKLLQIAESRNIDLAYIACIRIMEV